MQSEHGLFRFKISFLLLAGSLAGAAASHALSPPCTDPIDDPANVLEKTQVVLFGELHGTQQIPQFVMSAACHALSLNRSVTVGLEIPQAETPRLEAFLAAAWPCSTWSTRCASGAGAVSP
jgi:hypothetical protein